MLPLDIRYDYDFSSLPNVTIIFRVANDELGIFATTNFIESITIGTPQNPATNTFPTVEDAAVYYQAASSAWLLSQVNAAGLGTYTLRDFFPFTRKSVNDLIISKLAAVPSFNPAAPVAAGLAFVGTGATGTQISSTRPTQVFATVGTSATASIAGAAVSTVVLKACATNDSNEANWTTYGTSETSQSYSLAVALQGVTGGKAQLATPVLPPGWFVKLSNSGTGTHSESIISSFKTVY